MKIFFGASITGIPKETLNQYNSNLNSIQHQISTIPSVTSVISSQNNPAPIDRSKFTLESSQELYLWYKSLIMKSDLFIGDITYPSIGLGIEVQLTVENNIPLVLLFDGNYISYEKLSRMVHGLPNNPKFYRYENVSSAMDQIKKSLLEWA